MKELEIERLTCAVVAPDLSTLPSWEGAKRVAIDCETRDPDLLRKMIAEVEL